MTTTEQNNPPEKARILIVDDDPLVLELLGISISAFGFDFVAANNGREAMEILKEQEFTIVITDMMMPEVDGMTLLTHIGKEYPHTRVIVVTGYTGTFSYMDVIRAGASDFISKPFNSDELEAKINRVLLEQKMISNLEYLSNCDALTGLFNRRHFDKKIREEVHRADRQGYSVFLTLVDVDKFKDYNDEHGHQQGDQVLIEIGAILKNCTREDVDLIFRHGGDEFAIITPHIIHEQVAMVVERILASYNKHSFAGTGLSLGVAKFIRSDNDIDDDVSSLFRRADQALYLAKGQGGNQIISNTPETSG
jgi:two-component system cell cycle response regulator